MIRREYASTMGEYNRRGYDRSLGCNVDAHVDAPVVPRGDGWQLLNTAISDGTIIWTWWRGVAVEDDECAGAGQCHGCLKWCSKCGDVSRVCHADTGMCDTHRPPSDNDVDDAVLWIVGADGLDDGAVCAAVQARFADAGHQPPTQAQVQVAIRRLDADGNIHMRDGRWRSGSGS